MELKRYVLLNDYNLILDSKNEEELRVVHYADGDELKVVVDNWYYPLAKLDYKTSDNILNLVELGDLVEDGNNIMRVAQYENGVFFDVDSYTCQEGFVKAIYKRQTNGDYVRYEVEGDL